MHDQTVYVKDGIQAGPDRPTHPDMCPNAADSINHSKYRLRSTLTGTRGQISFLLAVRPLKSTSLQRARFEIDARNWSERGIRPDHIAILDRDGRTLATRAYRRSGPWY
jgi:hypothetical protein